MGKNTTIFFLSFFSSLTILSFLYVKYFMFKKNLRFLASSISAVVVFCFIYLSINNIDYLNNSSYRMVRMDPEGAELAAEVNAIKREWAAMRERGRFVKRLHSAEEIAPHRLGERPDFNIQNLISWEIYDKLRHAQANQMLLPTIGGFDETSAVAMAESGLDSLYSGGWFASQTMGDPDLARRSREIMKSYVTRVSRRLWRAHDDQKVRRSMMSPEERANTPQIDFRVPLMVDIDTGFDAPYEATIELVGTVVDGNPNLVGLVHIEDQATGCKKCGHLGGRVNISTQAMIERLNEIRKALDVLGVATLVVARTDAEGSEFISAIRDKRDHRFILGSTNIEARSLEEFTEDLEGRDLSKEELAKSKQNWRNEEAKLLTMGEAIYKVIQLAEATGNNRGMSLNEWKNFSETASFEDLRERAKDLKIRVTEKLKEEAEELGYQIRGRNGQEVGVFIHNKEGWQNSQEGGSQFPTGINIFWDKDQASIMEGDHMYWMVDSGLDMAIARSKAYLPYADVSWMEQKKPKPEQIAEWAEALDEEWEKVLLEEWGVVQSEEEQRLGISLKPLKAMNISPNFNWIEFFDERVEEYRRELEKSGVAPGVAKERAQERALEEIKGYSQTIAEAGIQLPFNTFGLSQIIHHSAFTFLEQYIENPIEAWTAYQHKMFEADDSYAANAQAFAGLLSVFFRDAAGRQLIASPLGSGSTMDQFDGEKEN